MRRSPQRDAGTEQAQLETLDGASARRSGYMNSSETPCAELDFRAGVSDS